MNIQSFSTDSKRHQAIDLNLRNILLKYGWLDELENNQAYYQIKTPFIAESAYLNIIFKPAAMEDIKMASNELKIPPVWVDFFSIQNGALLFSNSLSLFGIMPSTALYNRSDTVITPPHNIKFENYNKYDLDLNRLLIVGSYGFDGSLLCLDREDQTVWHCYKDGTRGDLVGKNAFSWIRNEISRLSFLFDKRGKCLSTEMETVPKRGPIRVT
ncbi:MAG: hypothetical protein JSS87_02205 [Acidobacteria bacterium]|nr:hypothetical protein [Acidobacteriota bacterium]